MRHDLMVAVASGSLGRELVPAFGDEYRSVGVLFAPFVDEALFDFVLAAVREEIERARRWFDVAG